MVFNGDDVKDFPFGIAKPELTIVFAKPEDFDAFREKLIERMRDYEIASWSHNKFMLDVVGAKP